MPLRPPAGFISAFYDPLNNPNAPTIGTATGGDASASVTFTAPTNVGGSAISSYSALSTPGGFVGTAASSPISVTGLTNGTAYTFAVWATNTYGPSAFSAASGSVTPAVPPPEGIFASTAMQIDYVNISTLGNAQTFGDLVAGTFYNPAGCGSATRGVIAGGGIGLAPTLSNVIQYITFATTGNATDFGDLAVSKDYLMGCSSATRGLFAGGASTSPAPSYITTYFQTIEYITIASTGNASSFGDLTLGVRSGAGFASPTRGVFGAGFNGSGNNVINYVTIASTGNATDFGDTTTNKYDLAGFSSSTRGIFAGGSQSARNIIDYITIASTGNATDFGDLLFGQYRNYGCSSNTRGLSAGGRNINDGGAQTNVIQYVTIASTGNALDFGDLIATDDNAASCSNVHGGLQ